MKAATTKALADFDVAMTDDFNTREAVAVLFDYSRAVNKAIDSGAGRTALDEAARAFRTFGEILGIFAPPAEGADTVARLLDLLLALPEASANRTDITPPHR